LTVGFSVFCDDSARTTENPSYLGGCTGSNDGFFTADGMAPLDYLFSIWEEPFYYIGRSDDPGNGPFTENPGTKTGTLYFKAPQKGYFAVWLQGVPNAQGLAWNSQYYFNGGASGVSSIDFDTQGIWKSQQGGQAGRGPLLAFAALFTLQPPVVGEAGPALALVYRVRLAPSMVPTEDAELQFDFWVPDSLNGAALAPSSSPHHALDLAMTPTVPATWVTATGMTITGVSVIASGVADPSAAGAGLPTPTGATGRHYRVEATFLAGNGAAEWPMLLGSAAVDNPATDNPWPGGVPLDRSIAAFAVRVADVPVAGAVHRRVIVNA
jgi:hypothetical protein